MAVLNVVTTLARPVNITRIHRSLWHTYQDIKMRWIVIANAKSDPDVYDRLLQTNDLIDIVPSHHFEPGLGFAQRNYALDELVSPGWCVWVNDNTIMHPLFMQSFRRFVMFGWKGVLVGQGRPDGYYTPDRNHLDIGQLVAHTDVIGDTRFGLHDDAAADFIRSLMPKTNFTFVDEELSYQRWISRGTGARE